MNTLNLVYVIHSLKRRWVKEIFTLFTNPVDKAAEQFRKTMPQNILWGLNGRFERGVAMAKQGAVSPHINHNLPDKQRQFQVKSANQSRPDLFYLVDLDAGTCNCPDHLKGHFCKHLIAAHIIEWVNYNHQLAASSNVQLSSIKDSQTQDAPAANAQLTETSLDAVPSTTTTDAIIWGVLKHGGQWLGVEILAMEGDNATIRALPQIINGKKLQPQFPFEGKRCTTTIPKKHIFHVKIFQ